MLVVQDVLTDAREVLQDTDVPFRYTDGSLLRILNMGLLVIRAERPDAFIGLFHVATPRARNAGDTVPVPETFHPALVDYVAGRAELRDEDYAENGRAMALIANFTRSIKAL